MTEADVTEQIARRTAHGFVNQDSIDDAVSAAVADLIGGAPGALDTLNELAAAMADDANFATTLTNQLALKGDKSPAIRDITDAAATITQADNGKIIRADRATAQTLTVTAPIAAGFNCLIIQRGDGLVSFAADGLTMTNVDGFTDSAGKNSVMGLAADGADAVVLSGRLA